MEKSTIGVDDGVEYLSVGLDFQLSQNQIRDVMKQNASQMSSQNSNKTKNPIQDNKNNLKSMSRLNGLK